ncbi:3-phenylpropionate/trans-cinnamate dioxygenase ferredoxin reductase subunit [Litorimonas taeanensis]|uniref:3-phenylpropionate/trans-cinnamate dioxygenase ferredoxin reductase subunit n=1 Tax=Litorimonas taeanensis TaxID=568099 RepID=A0A420WIE8_9PROT|nr:FAD/NAD(P)-binding oxidoreductase [Litorimonas taeanensis]RKQ70722.1 3-phenylpropionate/trans-cinnamate dioxygenase ferredoxin reductase subunit [Litorimonas taeanensis]
MVKSVVIIGASHAAAQTCVSLRQGGWEGDITVIGDEAVLPYHRPPLSKDFLSGQKSIDDILIRPAEVYEKAKIDLKLGHRVGSINRHEKSVLTDDGQVFSYDKLVLTTGARIRRLPIAGEDLEGVFYLRDTKDVLAIKAKAETATKAVIIGGGYIGLETAASLRKQGLEVVVLEAMPRILQRVTAPEMSQFYKRIHKEEGVEIFETVIASEIQKTDKGLSVSTSCEKTFQADMVIIGIGVIPNIDLAETAGLNIGNGIEVNAFCQTSDPDIYAAGDVSWHYNAIYDTHLRLESVPNATEQAKVVAQHINGTPKPYNSLPWFWSDQFDLKLQIAGLSTGYDEVIIRGDAETSRNFAAYYFKKGRFIAVDAVNAPRDFMFGKMSLTKGVNLDRSKLANLSIDLKNCVAL